MGVEGIIAITVALIGVVSGLWGQIIQFKKDGNTIKDVKVDTTEIRPKVQEVSENVKDIKRDITYRILNHIEKLDGVDELVDELHFQQRLKQDISKELLPQDNFVAELQRLYEKIATLEQEKSLANEKVKQLQIVNIKLEQTLNNYKKREREKSRNSHDLSL